MWLWSCRRAGSLQALSEYLLNEWITEEDGKWINFDFWLTYIGIIIL